MGLRSPTDAHINRQTLLSIVKAVNLMFFVLPKTQLALKSYTTQTFGESINEKTRLCSVRVLVLR